VVATGLVGRVRWGAWLPLPLDCGHDFVGSRNHVVGSSPSTQRRVESWWRPPQGWHRRAGHGRSGRGSRRCRGRRL